MRAQEDLNGIAAQEFVKLFNELKDRIGGRAARTGLVWAAEEKQVVVQE